MNRIELRQLILDRYGTEPDHPWVKYPDFEVFRHDINKKWFALAMDIERSRIGLHGDDMIDVVNLKCDPVLIGSLLTESGFYPAYHMNKSSWITAALDGSADDDMIAMLVDMSFGATAPKIKKAKG